MSEETASTAQDNIDPLYRFDESISTINGWDFDTITYVKKIGDLAGAYNWIHNNTAFWYIVLNYIFHFVVIFLQAPAFTGIMTTLSDTADNIYVKIAVAVIIAISTVLKSIHVYINLPGKISDRRASATRYSTIFSKVRNELINSDETRREASKFIEEIEKEFEECYSESPQCWSIVVRRYLLMVRGKVELEYAELSGIREIQVRRRRKKRRAQPSDNDADEESAEETATATPIASKMINMFGGGIFRMNKAQKQYQMDRHFIDV